MFDPPALVGPVPFANLQAMIGKAETALKAHNPDEVNSWSGRELDLQIGPRRLAFTSEIFILIVLAAQFSFSRCYCLRHPARAGHTDWQARL